MSITEEQEYNDFPKEVSNKVMVLHKKYNNFSDNNKRRFLFIHRVDGLCQRNTRFYESDEHFV